MDKSTTSKTWKKSELWGEIRDICKTILHIVDKCKHGIGETFPKHYTFTVEYEELLTFINITFQELKVFVEACLQC